MPGSCYKERLVGLTKGYFRENKVPSIIAGLNGRLLNSREEEIQNGIGEVKKIARLRALDVLKSLAPVSKL